MHQGFTILGIFAAITLLLVAATEWRAFERSAHRIHAFGALSSLIAAMGLTANLLS